MRRCTWKDRGLFDSCFTVSFKQFGLRDSTSVSLDKAGKPSEGESNSGFPNQSIGHLNDLLEVGGR